MVYLTGITLEKSEDFVEVFIHFSLYFDSCFNYALLSSSNLQRAFFSRMKVLGFRFMVKEYKVVAISSILTHFNLTVIIAIQ